MAAIYLAANISSYHTAAFFGVVILVYLALRRRRVRRLANPRNLPYPPGPTPLPIIDNLFDIARDNETATYQLLAKEYGDLVFLSTLGKYILFLNSFKTANQLFEKRSANYSDRPQSTMSHDHEPRPNGMGVQPWTHALRVVLQFEHWPVSGDRWKKRRRMFHHQFQQSNSPAFWPIQLREARGLLRRLLQSPDRLDYHLRHNAAAVIMSVTYGITIDSTEDKYIVLAETALEGMQNLLALVPFCWTWYLPVMKYIPDWVPGASFKRKAREWRAAVTGMKEAPFATVVNEMQSGKAPPSFVSNLLNDLGSGKGSDEDEIETIQNCAGIAYAAGAESTVSTIASFFLAVLIHPEVQKKTQMELDAVVGRNRLPDFNDRPSLPYISAIVKEVLHWNSVAPLGLPHMVTHDDEFNGYFIPAGTIIVGNSWGILNDPNVYLDPRRFNPDRFIGEGDKGPSQHLSPTDTLSVAFGYGRRACPGRHMGEAQVWISIACILSAFDITPALYEDGRPMEVVPAFSSGIICHPLPFKFAMMPRGENYKSLIEQTEFHTYL